MDVKWVVGEASHTRLNLQIRSGVCDCRGCFFHLRCGGAKARHRLLWRLLWQFIGDDETTVLSKAEMCRWWITRFHLLPASDFRMASCASVSIEPWFSFYSKQATFFRPHSACTSEANKSLIWPRVHATLLSLSYGCKHVSLCPDRIITWRNSLQIISWVDISRRHY